MPPRILSGDQGGYAQPHGGSALSKVPTWVWYGVGAVAALFIIMKLRSGGSTGSVLQSGTQGTAADGSILGAPNTPSTLGITSPNGSSINLGNVNLTPDETAQIIGSLFPLPNSTSALPTGGGTPGPTDPGTVKGGARTPGPASTPVNAPGPTFETVGKWPNWNGSLSGIAQHHGMSLSVLERLNPQLQRGSHNWGLIYPGEKVRLS